MGTTTAVTRRRAPLKGPAMASYLVSGHVSERCKARADLFIENAGLTADDVIRIVWENIAKTGKVPEPVEAPPAEENPLVKRLEELIATTPRSPYLESLTAADIRRIVRDRDDL